MTIDIYATMDKVRAVSAMFSPEGVTGSRELSVEAANGVSLILDGCAGEIGAYGEQVEEQESRKGSRERRLERFLKGLSDFLLEDPDPVDLKTMAANIREQLDQ